MESLRLQRGSLGSLLPLIRPLESPLLQRGPPGSPQPHGRPRGTLKPLQRLLESLYPRGPRKGGGNSTSPPRVGGADPRDLPIDKSAPMSVPEAVAPQGPYKERPPRSPIARPHRTVPPEPSHLSPYQVCHPQGPPGAAEPPGTPRIGGYMGSLRGVGDPTGFSRGGLLRAQQEAEPTGPQGGQTPMGLPMALTPPTAQGGTKGGEHPRSPSRKDNLRGLITRHRRHLRPGRNR
ncbi:basic salivary proline-rich protein 2-like [Homarus americanus]|uniref:basic salivary proline-rich protein 2-like n=1 Tax=Homarus americanus TaxID=6706 RepID=UPI001C48EB3E|nr:basic salivary proline-rich protein 2-like [Homarus americanus]